MEPDGGFWNGGIRGLEKTPKLKLRGRNLFYDFLVRSCVIAAGDLVIQL
jgi:hypothetical protein